jgi:hypothetical protein
VPILRPISSQKNGRSDGLANLAKTDSLTVERLAVTNCHRFEAAFLIEVFSV